MQASAQRPGVIVLGCACMSTAAPKLNDRSSVPAVNATQRAVDLAASLGAKHGPLTLHDADAGRAGSITSFIRDLGENACWSPTSETLRAVASAMA